MQKIGKKIALTVTAEQEERISKIAQKYKISKAKAYRNMIDVGLDLHDDLSKIGLPHLVAFTDKIKTMSKDWMSTRQGRLF